MATKFFTEAEAYEAICHSDLYSEVTYRGDWTETTRTISRVDGKLYELFWESGLTESQEDFFYGQDAKEVEESVELEVGFNKRFTPTDTAKKEKFKLAPKAVRAAALISPDADAGIEAIKNFDAQAVLKQLELMSGALVTMDAEARLHAARELFEAIDKVKRWV